MEPATPLTENKIFEQKCSTVIKENANEYVLNCGINGESIYFELKGENDKYLNIFSLNSLKCINNWFNQFSSIDKIIKAVKNIINSFKIKEDENEKEGKIIYFMNPIDEDEIISLKLKKVKKDAKEMYDDLKEKIKKLEEKNLSLENKNVFLGEQLNNIEKKYDRKIEELQKQIDNMKGIINTLKNSKLMDSLIVKKEEDINLLKKWISINKKITFNLIYRASRDGDTIDDFHRMCDNKSPTIVICKTPKGYIFGGYTTLNYNNENNKVFKLLDEKAFVFSLNQKAKFESLNDENYIYIDWKYLIIFGDGRNSIQINDNALKSNKHWSNSNGSYGNNLNLTESEHFSLVELEVFQVYFNK